MWSEWLVSGYWWLVDILFAGIWHPTVIFQIFVHQNAPSPSYLVFFIAIIIHCAAAANVSVAGLDIFMPWGT